MRRDESSTRAPGVEFRIEDERSVDPVTIAGVNLATRS